MNPDWPTPDEFPALGDGEIHIWLVNLTAPQTVHLSPDEQERADRFKVDKPRQQFTAARSALRLLLGKYLSAEPTSIEFNYAEHGKPSIQSPATDIQFNVSHSHDYALLAFAKELSLGVDIEWLGRTAEIDALAKRFYSPDEQDQLTALSAGARHDAFLKCWTQKEAYLKAHGSGLSRDTRTFSVSIDGGLISDEQDPGANSKWSIQSLAPAEGYCAAIAAGVPEFSVQTFSLT